MGTQVVGDDLENQNSTIVADFEYQNHVIMSHNELRLETEYTEDQKISRRSSEKHITPSWHKDYQISANYVRKC